MSLIITFEDITEADRRRVGGKGYALNLMSRTGAKVPSGVCVTVDAYCRYVRLTGLADRMTRRSGNVFLPGVSEYVLIRAEGSGSKSCPVILVILTSVPSPWQKLI